MLADWWIELQSTGANTDNRITETELRKQTKEFLTLLQGAARTGNLLDLEQPEWMPVQDFLDEISRFHAIQGQHIPDSDADFLFEEAFPGVVTKMNVSRIGF